MEKGGGKIESVARITRPLNKDEFIDFAKKFGQNLSKGDLVLLRGDLGSGKTTFVKGLALSLGVDEDIVNSPTFVILNIYDGMVKLYHMDLYRLESIDDFLESGLEEYLFPKDGVTVIEWPDIIRTICPEEFLEINIEFTDFNTRRLKIHPRGKKYENRFLRGEMYYENIQNR